MDRRRFITTASALAVGALAGCLEDGGADTPTPTDSPIMTDTEFTIRQTESGTEIDEATVTFDGTTVTVEGTIWGADGCTTAELVVAGYDAEADELTVAVATTKPESTADLACTQATVEIDYRAMVLFENRLPGRVVVTHNHGDGAQQVTTASP